MAIPSGIPSSSLTIFFHSQFDQFEYLVEFFNCISSVIRCFLFSLLSMRVSLASATSWFGYVAVLSLFYVDDIERL